MHDLHLVLHAHIKSKNLLPRQDAGGISCRYFSTGCLGNTTILSRERDRAVALLDVRSRLPVLCVQNNRSTIPYSSFPR
jgi:hypothetical protein